RLGEPDPMTPVTYPGKAYYIGDPDAPAALSAEMRIQVATDRLFGLTPEAIERACEAAVFSDRARVRLWTQYRNQVQAHRQFVHLTEGAEDARQRDAGKPEAKRAFSKYTPLRF